MTQTEDCSAAERRNQSIFVLILAEMRKILFLIYFFIINYYKRKALS